jgi:hypothetical protein
VQRLIDGKALDDGAGGGNAEHGLGDEGARQAAAILARPAGPSRWLGNEGFEAITSRMVTSRPSNSVIDRFAIIIK